MKQHNNNEIKKAGRFATLFFPVKVLICILITIFSYSLSLFWIFQSVTLFLRLIFHKPNKKVILYKFPLGFLVRALVFIISPFLPLYNAIELIPENTDSEFEKTVNISLATMFALICCASLIADHAEFHEKRLARGCTKKDWLFQNR